MKRLLSYMKPFRKTFFACLLLISVATLLELYEPILVGGAIDRYISGYSFPYKETADGPIAFEGRTYEKEAQSPKERALSEGTYGSVLLWEDTYYWAGGLSAEEASAAFELTAEEIRPAGEEAVTANLAGRTVTAKRLSKEDLKVLRRTDFDGIIRSAVLYFIILAVMFVIQRTQYMTLQKMGQSIVRNVRKEVFAHVQSLSMNFFDKTPVGTIVTRITNDVESLNEMYSNLMVNLIQNLLRILGILIMMVVLNVRMTFFSILMIPIVVFLSFLFRKYARAAYDFTRTQITGINIFLSEHLSGMRVIQMFRREDVKDEEFRAASQNLYRANFKELMTFAVFRPAINMTYFLTRAIVLIAGARFVLSGRITLGTLYIFTQYTASLFDPIQELAEQFSSLQQAAASSEKIFRVLDEKPVITEKPDAAVLKDVRGEIVFDHVWFAYNEDNYVLKDVSFRIRPGEKVAFVGATGAGKTSILSLIGRYYDIQKGSITVDGTDVRDLTIESLRRAIGQVQQDVFIFTGDIAGNIRLMDESIPDEKVEEAARSVNASHFIERLPGKYHEPVTERGSTFSAGERQLLSFARTLAFDPKILILDEATANIDSETEVLIQDALGRMMKDRTTIMVAHRLSTIENCDTIIVLDHGRIVEKGNHEQLMKAGGRYYDLYMSSGDIMA